jgi:NADH:ubiquinone oxidoreductase subunit H
MLLMGSLLSLLFFGGWYAPFFFLIIVFGLVSKILFLLFFEFEFVLLCQGLDLIN